MKIESPHHAVIGITPALGWKAEFGEESELRFIAITPETGDAELRITPGRLPERDFTATQWIDAVADIAREKQRSVSDCQVGQFEGRCEEFASGDVWVRGWSLQCDGIPVDLCYRCKTDIRGRDDNAVSSMVNTLQKE